MVVVSFLLILALPFVGIVYNRELIAERGLPEPKVFSDLTDFRYYRGLALTDPRQSGSVTTTYESILNKDGWDEGWRVLREMGANARSFASASTKPPVDVSQGDALAGLAIDFYGRAQAQAVLRKDEDPASGRVGYVDPRGEVYIDADPVSILRAGPNPRLARRFVEFCLSDEGQALWQLPPRSSSAGQSNPIGESGRRLGPERYSLRRLPSRHAIYEKHLEHFVDRVDPFELAAPLPDRRWRRSIDVMIGAFAVDTLDELRVAWEALNAARRDEAFPRDVLAKMERDFHAFPRGEDVKRLAASLFPGLRLPDDAVLDFSPETSGGVEDNCRRIVATWGDADLKARLRVIYTEFFREKYVGVAAMARARK